MDLTRWLQSDLGLKNLTEADLNALVYHPRHGSLCRRFLAFLAESTLSHKKYPNIYAREECEGTQLDLMTKEQELGHIKLVLERQLQTSSNTELELKFLKDKHQHIASLEDLLRATTKALEEIASRPSVAFERARRIIKEANLNYLSNDDIEKIYSIGLSSGGAHSACPTPTDEELSKCVQTVDTIHRAISSLLTDVSSKIDTNAVQSRTLKQPNIESLVALKIPECERLELEANPEELELTERRAALRRAIELLSMEVKALDDKLSAEKQKLEENFKRQREVDVNFLEKLQRLEEEIYESVAQ